MGQYVYTVRTRHVDATDGRRVFGTKYAGKPYLDMFAFGLCTTARQVNAAIARLEGTARAAFERRGESPHYIVHGDIADGAAVRHNPGGATSYLDDSALDRWPVVGVLRRAGRAWRIEPV